MKYKYEYVLSTMHLQNQRQLTGDEAIEKLKEMGLDFVHVDDNGNIRALNKQNKVLEDYFLFEKKIPVIE